MDYGPDTKTVGDNYTKKGMIEPWEIALLYDDWDIDEDS
jgi:hypothetical protein